MSGLKDVKFLITQSADEFIEQAPGQYDAMKKPSAKRRWTTMAKR